MTTAPVLAQHLSPGLAQSSLHNEPSSFLSCLFQYIFRVMGTVSVQICTSDRVTALLGFRRNYDFLSMTHKVLQDPLSLSLKFIPC